MPLAHCPLVRYLLNRGLLTQCDVLCFSRNSCHCKVFLPGLASCNQVVHVETAAPLEDVTDLQKPCRRETTQGVLPAEKRMYSTVKRFFLVKLQPYHQGEGSNS